MKRVHTKNAERPEVDRGPLSIELFRLVVRELKEETEKTARWGQRVLPAKVETEQEEIEDLLAELVVSLTLIEAKAQFLQEAFDSFGEALPYVEDTEPEEPTPLFWSLAEAARDFGLSASTLRNQAVKRRLGAVKIGRNWCTTREWMEEYLVGRKKNGKPVRTG